MRTMMRMTAGLALVMSVGLLAVTPAKAQPSGNSGDGFTITLTPTGERGVIIDTTTIAMTGLALGTTNYTAGAQGVVVIATGTIAPIYYTIQGALAGGWTLSTDGYAETQNILAVHALFKATAPTPEDFAGTDIVKNLLTTDVNHIGSVGSVGKYEVADGQEMTELALNDSRNLWFQIKTPPTSSTLGTQTITVTVTAETNQPV